MYGDDKFIKWHVSETVISSMNNGGSGGPPGPLLLPPWQIGKRRRMFVDEDNDEERDDDRIKTAQTDDLVPENDVCVLLVKLKFFIECF